MAKIDLEKWICSMIEAFPAFKEEGRVPCMYEQALKDQGLQYKDGKIVPVEEESFKIEAGKFYMCKFDRYYTGKDVRLQFTCGKVYESPKDLYLIDNCGNFVSPYLIPGIMPEDYFRLAADEEITEKNLQHDSLYILNEEKPQPKFKVGDWLTYMHTPVQVTKILEDGYECFDGVGYIHLDFSSDSYSLWTIQDAKDGDVLADGSCIFLFEERKENGALVYCALHDDGEFSNGCLLFFYEKNTHPATKEQRDRLFKAMRDAGYEWDADAKQLKKKEEPKKCPCDECNLYCNGALPTCPDYKAYIEEPKQEFHPVKKRHIPEDSTLGKLIAEVKREKSTPELTEFEKAVRDIITTELCNNFGDVSFGISISEDEAKLIAHKILKNLKKCYEAGREKGDNR